VERIDIGEPENTGMSDLVRRSFVVEYLDFV